MYKYEEQRPKLFTESGMKQYISIRDRAFVLIHDAGAVSAGKLIEGDGWLSLACLDYLVETGDLIEVTDKTKVFGQDRIFVAKYG